MSDQHSGRPAELDELGELHSKTTVDSWHVCNPDDEYCMNAFAVVAGRGDIDDLVAGEFKDRGRVVALTLLQVPDFAAVADNRWFENAQFIAAAHNHWPQISAYIQGLEAGAASLREALEKIRTHDEGLGPPCDFGAGTQGCDDCSDMRRIADAALSSTTSGKAPLDRIQTLEEQVRRLTPSESVCRDIELGSRELDSEGFHEEAANVRDFLELISDVTSYHP